MSSFTLLRTGGSALVEIEHVDLNIWILPSLFRRQVYYCDIGVCFILKDDIRDHSVELELRVPFLPDDDDVIDLVPRMRESEALCSLIFGNSNLNVTRDSLGTWVSDDTGPLLLTDLPSTKRKKAPSDETRAASWVISTGPISLAANTRLYVRMRVTTHEPNCLWTWQRGERWNSHALCDLRVNEFREKGKSDFPVDFSKVITLARVNGFLISPARYKAGRVNPIPKYVRVLESDSWTGYLGRRLSRNKELFLITYWKDTEVSPAHPFRAFMEMERRRPTATRTIISATFLVLFAILASQPFSSLSQSPLGLLIGHLGTLITLAISGLTIGGIWSVTKLIMTQIRSGNWDRMRQRVKRVEQWWYRAP